MFAFAPLRDILPEWIANRLGFLGDAIDQVGLTEFDIVSDDASGMESEGTAAWLKEIEFPIPGFEVASLVLLAGNEMTEVHFAYKRRPDLEIRLESLSAALRINSELFHPVHEEPIGTWSRSFDAEGRPVPFEIGLSGVNVSVDADWDVDLENLPVLNVTPAELGDTGIILELKDIGLHLSSKTPPPAGAPAGFKGVSIGKADLHFTGDFQIGGIDDITLTDALIGSSGFSGRIKAEWDPAESGSLFGLDFTLQSIDLTFKQNVPVGGGLKGTIALPFFDHGAEVDISYDAEGGLSVKLSSPDGLKSFTKKGILAMTLDSVGFSIDDGEFAILVSGKLTPEIGNLSWPTFDVKELSIDSKGHVKLQGGWLDLPSQYSLDLYGFTVEITKLGFGKTDDGGKWIGFSGALHLVDGLSAGASVEGLRVTWYPDRDPKVTLEGAGVEFEIPDVLRFKGAVSLRVLDVTTSSGAIEHVRRFDGDISLELLALGLTIDGTLVIGTAVPQSGPRYRFFAIYLDVELPVGIPLGSTGVSLYGFAGLFANNMEPDRHAAEPWYGIGTAGWYHRPEVGVTDLKAKWRNERRSLGFGAGVTLGTGSDNGFTFAGKVLLLVIFPGPIIMLQGKANLLKERAKLSDEALFRSLTVLDFRSDTFLMGLDAQYKTGDSGELIDLKVGAEAFFDFKDPLAWYIHLGEKEPRERRIRASLFRIFEANSYLMIDAHQLATGAWVGFGKSWSFGPVGLVMEAWIEGNAAISWKPAHFHGDLWLHGALAIRVFKFRLGLMVDAAISADVFKPFHVKAEIAASIDLPRPFKSRSVKAVLEWGPDHGIPPVPLPLQEVAIEHLLSTTTWPLGRWTEPAPAPQADWQPLIFPNYDLDRDGFIDAAPTGVGIVLPPPAHAPVVPVDARPRLTFARPVHDDALVGVNAQPVVPAWEVIGDPTSSNAPNTARFALTKLVLSEWTGTAWAPVASAPQDTGLRALYGSWAPVPAVPDGGGPNLGQVKLWLWSKTPFDYTRHTTGAWDEWFTDHYPGYPCPPPAPDRAFCCTFEGARPGPVTGHVWTWPDHKEVALAWPGSLVAQVTTLAPAVDGLTQALCFSPVRPEPKPAPAPRPVPPPVRPGPGPVVGPGGPLPARPASAPTPEPAPRPRPVPFPGPAAVRGPVPIPGRDTGVRPADLAALGVEVRLAEPARRVTVLLAFPPGAPTRQCVDFRRDKMGTGPNPRDRSGVVFTASGTPKPPTTTIARAATSTGSVLGLLVRPVMTIDLPRDSDFAEVTLTAMGEGARISGLDRTGAVVAAMAVGAARKVTTTVQLTGPKIRRVTVQAGSTEAYLHQICLAGPPAAPQIDAVARDNKGGQSGPFAMDGSTIDVTGRDIVQVLLRGDQPFCIVRVCVNLCPDPDEVERREEMLKHAQDELARWSQAGDVLTPRTSYQLAVKTTVRSSNPDTGEVPHEQTEYAYFTTGAPPGLGEYTRPPGVPKTAVFTTGLEDLTRYVSQTVPATVPALGQQPPLPRPVYRSYDVGVEFNQDYVDLMYRLDRRDLGLHLYDANNRPVRDATGRLVVLANQWGRTETLTLSASDDKWITTLNASGCLVLDTENIPHKLTIGASSEGQVLEPDFLHEARLVPLLLHETWSAANALDAWTVVDLGSGGPSNWSVGSDPADPTVVQTGTIGGGDTTGILPGKPGTLLLLADGGPFTPAADQPGNWTDYRFAVTVRSGEDGAIGVVFRFVDAGNYYRFSMDRARRRRQLVRVVNGAAAVLAEDDELYRVGFDSVVAVEAIGDSLVVGVDGVLLFAVADTAHPQGRVGLYSWANPGARFADARVDDFRQGAPVAYRFKFTTSEFVNFFHHLHSFCDRSWSLPIANQQVSDADLVAAAGQGVTLNAPLAEAEWRAYQALAAAILGPAADQDPPRLEVTRVQRPSGKDFALLVRSPEPIDWARTTLTVLRSPQILPDAQAGESSPVKLTSAGFATDRPNDESVSLLLQRSVDLTGWQVERRLTDGLPAPRAGEILFLDDEHRADGVPDADRRLEPWTVTDLATGGTPSVWRASRGVLSQAAVVAGGTVATSGALASPDYRATVRLHSDGEGAVGVAFRYLDGANHYRFALGASPPFRRLERVVAGTVTTLWSDSGALAVGQSVMIAVEAVGTRLQGWVDGNHAFEVVDGALPDGRIGLYCAGTQGAHFERVEVRQRPLLVDQFHLGTTQGWDFSTGSGAWSTAQAALAHAGTSAGASALAGDPSWTDVMVTADLRATTGAVGMLFRAVDGTHCYRFVLADQATGATLVKVNGGATQVLWGTPALSTPGQVHRVTVVAEGSTLRGFVDGVPAFVVDDADYPAGRIGLWATGDARIANVRAHSLASTTSIWLLDDSFTTFTPGRWRAIDEASHGGPSAWSFDGGELRQTSPIGDEPTGDDFPGTQMIAGDPTWADYRLTVRLRSDGPGAIGVLFRVASDDTYYRLSMDPEAPYRRLVKRLRGQLTTLWQDATPITTEADHLLTIDCAGGRLTGHLDGVPMFRVDDDAVGAGRVGLYCWGNAAARFGEVRVAPPQWSPWFRFGSEDIRPAGTPVRLLSGGTDDPVAAVPGQVDRYAAASGDRGDVSLPTTGARLRIVDPDGNAGHERTFLPPSAFGPADLRLLRKPDGTAFVLLRPPNAASPRWLPVGSYRLTFTYRRDNTGAMPTSQVLKQAGRSDDETATLDVP